MPGRFGRRFALEALFLVAVAFVAWLLDLSIAAIVAVMFCAWLLTAWLEWQAARGRVPSVASRLRRTRSEAEAGEPAAEQAPPRRPIEQEQQPHVRVIPREPDPAAQPVLERAASGPDVPVEPPPPAPEPVPPAAEAGIAVLPEDVRPVGVPVAETVPPEVPEPEPAEPAEAEPEPERAQLVPVPEPPPPPEPEAEPEPVAAVVALPVPETPREWNLWDLERVARERPAEDPLRAEEQAYLLVYLREFARPDGTLPLDFDRLVRESFGDLIEPARA